MLAGQLKRYYIRDTYEDRRFWKSAEAYSTWRYRFPLITGWCTKLSHALRNFYITDLEIEANALFCVAHGIRLKSKLVWRAAANCPFLERRRAISTSQLRQCWECLALYSPHAANVYCCSIRWPLAAMFLILASLDAASGMLRAACSIA